VPTLFIQAMDDPVELGRQRTTRAEMFLKAPEPREQGIIAHWKKIFVSRADRRRKARV